MSVKGKISTCVRKIVEATKAYEALNNLEKKGNPNTPKPQFFFMLDSGNKSHVAGYGKMFDNFVENQQLGFYSGQGTEPVDSNHPNYKNSLLQILSQDTNKSAKRKRRHSTGNERKFPF